MADTVADASWLIHMNIPDIYRIGNAQRRHGQTLEFLWYEDSCRTGDNQTVQVLIGQGHSRGRMGEHTSNEIPNTGEGPVALIESDQRRLQVDGIGLEYNLPAPFNGKSCRCECYDYPVDG